VADNEMGDLTDAFTRLRTGLRAEVRGRRPLCVGQPDLLQQYNECLQGESRSVYLNLKAEAAYFKTPLIQLVRNKLALGEKRQASGIL